MRVKKKKKKKTGLGMKLARNKVNDSRLKSVIDKVILVATSVTIIIIFFFANRQNNMRQELASLFSHLGYEVGFH